MTAPEEVDGAEALVAAVSLAEGRPELTSFGCVRVFSDDQRLVVMEVQENGAPSFQLRMTALVALDIAGRLSGAALREGSPHRDE